MKQDNKECVIHIRMSMKDKADIKIKAEKAGMKCSEYCRALVTADNDDWILKKTITEQVLSIEKICDDNEIKNKSIVRKIRKVICELWERL